MPQTVFHIVFAIIIAEFVREYAIKDKRKFPIHYVFIAGLAGILPDIDAAAFWISSFFGYTYQEWHRTFTHTLFVPILFLALAFITWNARKTFGKSRLKLNIIFLMIALGSFSHLFLDATIAGFINPFYPLSDLNIGLDLRQYLPYSLQPLLLPTLDGGIFVLWLIWLEWKHKLSRII